MLEIEKRQRTAVSIPMLAGRHNLERFAVSRKGRHLYYVQVTPSWRALETHGVLCVSTLSMFAYCSGAFGNGGQPYSGLLRGTAITEFTVMYFVCFILAAEFEVFNLFLPSHYHA